ncbi:MAG: phenylalanine--tRNA ligase subunit beta [Rickettsiales bacterium]|jgi:phenylalanyl-tRNA synthetase beta chain|nr:phenylalanine--tRNA ligase subunit beta [Rickettsiales bacterium]
MKFTLSALKKYLKTDKTPAEIADALTLLGLEVEEMRDARAPLAGFVVGEIVEAAPHPDSDHLRLLKVDAGSGILQVVCGAPNARKGLKGILSRPGDIIPSTGEKLRKGVIRGVESQGMMCSARELGLGSEHAGIVEIPADIEAEAGAPALSVLEKIYPIDVVFDAEVTPNRPDYLGVIGIARDLAAGGHGEFVAPETKVVKGAFDSPVRVENRIPEAAKQFNIRYIKGLGNGESPDWLKNYLSAVGAKAISALVDVTNYCAVDICRPLHVFDADKIRGALRIDFAKEGEKFAALDGGTYDLKPGDIVIRDDVGIQSLGGIMGGIAASCTPETKNVLLESAYFDPANIRRTAKRLGIESDAKYRFERGIDPASTAWGMEFATRMILDICGGEASHVVETGADPHREIAIEFPVAHFKDRIGLDMDRKDMVAILERLGCVVEAKGDALRVVPPSWRVDMAIKEDITEELLRIYGYDRLPAVSVTAGGMRPLLSPLQARKSAARRLLASLGLVEVYTWSFMDSSKEIDVAAPIRLANPIASGLDVMRQSIIPNLLSGVAENLARSVESVGLFEIAPVFKSAAPGDQAIFAGAVFGGNVVEKDWRSAPRAASAYDAKEAMLSLLALYGADAAKLRYRTEGLPSWVHPARGAAVAFAGKIVGYFGDVHPLALRKFGIRNAPVAAFELDLGALPAVKSKGAAKKKLSLSEFQTVSRDFAFLFSNDVAADEILRAARGADAMISDAWVFDVYRGAELGGKKSVALQIAVSPAASTLTDGEIQAISDKVIANVAKLGGALRDR